MINFFSLPSFVFELKIFLTEILGLLKFKNNNFITFFVNYFLGFLLGSLFFYILEEKMKCLRMGFLPIAYNLK